MSANQPEIIIIAALSAANRVIGKDGKLPWSIPADSQRFQSLTQGYAVIMGRKTWESDVGRCPLPQRYNIVVSSQSELGEIDADCLSQSLGVDLVSSVTAAIAKAQKFQKIFIVGGASIYAEALEIADTWELTLVEGDYDGDTLFPEYQALISKKFSLVAVEDHQQFRYETYRKILT
jgi:dihydrofolate reductase